MESISSQKNLKSYEFDTFVEFPKFYIVLDEAKIFFDKW